MICIHFLYLRAIGVVRRLFLLFMYYFIFNVSKKKSAFRNIKNVNRIKSKDLNTLVVHPATT